MTEEDFYNLSYEDMVDCLFRIKIKYKLSAISKQKILDLADLFRSGYKVESLKPYILAINKREQTQIDYENSTFYYKNRAWIEKWRRKNEWLWIESQKIIDAHKKEGGGDK